MVSLQLQPGLKSFHVRSISSIIELNFLNGNPFLKLCCGKSGIYILDVDKDDLFVFILMQMKM